MRGGSGITLHDIAYNGSRIMYELAFQDLMVAYSGYGGIVHSVSSVYLLLRVHPKATRRPLSTSYGFNNS